MTLVKAKKWLSERRIEKEKRVVEFEKFIDFLEKAELNLNLTPLTTNEEVEELIGILFEEVFPIIKEDELLDTIKEHSLSFGEGISADFRFCYLPSGKSFVNYTINHNSQLTARKFYNSL